MLTLVIAVEHVFRVRQSDARRHTRSSRISDARTSSRRHIRATSTPHLDESP